MDHDMTTLNQNEQVRRILAVLSPFIAFFLQWMFWETIKPYSWFFFFPAVFLSSWLGGLIVGLISTGYICGYRLVVFYPSHKLIYTRISNASFFHPDVHGHGRSLQPL